MNAYTTRFGTGALLLLTTTGMSGAIPAMALSGKTGDGSRTHAGTSLQGHGSHSAWWECEYGCQHHVGHAWSIDDAMPRTRGSFDESTGRSLLNYPAHRLVDYKRMTLLITIPDMNTPKWDATQRFSLAAIASPVSSIALNVGPAASMQIHTASISRAGATPVSVRMTHEGERLLLAFEPPLASGQDATLELSYTLQNPEEGIAWTPQTPEWPGRPAQLHSQGQPESNHYWFPCHDFPNEQLETELIVTVPAGFEALSNGRLVSRARSTTAANMEIFHWLQDKPHVNYLVTLVVGQFDIVDVASGGPIPMPVYAPLGRGGDVQRTYGRTPRMNALFERLFDEPYPWDKYAQAVVWNFGSGGMENTSATTMYDTAVLDERSLMDADLDGLISHELAHQWFGDLLTCNSWEHIWLNEGFATYLTHLWFEERDGKDAYLSGLWGTFQGLAASDKADAPYQPAMCSKEYDHPWEVFRRASNPYPKGASVLHMLRRKVGDRLFFDSLKLYVNRHKSSTVETDHLRYAFEEVCGISLERFFRQWCYRPGTPSADVTFSWDAGASTLNASLTQTQNIDGYNPAFFYTLPIWIKLPSGETRFLDLNVDGKIATTSFQLPAEPDLIAIDPDLHILGAFAASVPRGESNWRSLLTSAPTIAAKFQAVARIRALGAGNIAPETLAALNTLARNSSEHFSLRSAAVEAIASVGDTDAMLSLAADLPTDARVRRTVVDQLPGAYDAAKTAGAPAADTLLATLRSLASSDPSYAVRSSAIRGYAKLAGHDAKPVVLDALNTESQHDQLRQAALDALTSIDDAEALASAVRFTSPAAYPRTRPSAVNALAALAPHDKDLAFTTLRSLLTDRHDRTARAAGDALVRLGDPRGIEAIEAFIARSNRPAAKAIAQRWLRDLRDKNGQ